MCIRDSANTDNTKRIQLEIFGSDLYFQLLETGGGYARVDMPQGKWINLLCVFNSSEAAADRMIVYIDGERATNVAYVAPTITTTATDYTYSMIGARNNGLYFYGKLSNFVLWNTDQSATKTISTTTALLKHLIQFLHTTPNTPLSLIHI